ncbi:MAG: aminopeptidase P family protein [Elusimicrobia bacterium]|nr:aminopeptidase P family protein [Elusimicrobiota bacterium]
MDTFLQHRLAVSRKLPDGLILLAGGSPVLRNGDVCHPFRQGSDFLYLSGVEEPDCWVLIDPKRRRHTLFIPKVDSTHRVWLGHVPSPDEARKAYGFQRALQTHRLASVLRRARRGYRVLYADKAAQRRMAGIDAGACRGLTARPAALRDALDCLRAVKDAGELALLRRASSVTGLAFRAAMASVRPGMFEHEVQAVFEAECRRRGLKRLAFESIVASGANSAVLHYHGNDQRIRKGSLVLIDAGAEHLGYAADITRTFPVDGRFTARQRDVYSIVLDAQKAVIDAARPGVLSADLHVRSMTMIAEGLKGLGLLKGNVSGLVEGGAVRLFYPHGIGHMLGLDVHDPSGGRKRRLPNPTKVPVRFVAKLEPGFVVTVEPGIYFIPALLDDPANRRKFRGSVHFARAEAFRGFGGIRIEDDVVVARSGPPLDLTDVPKEIADVELLMAIRRPSGSSRSPA